jgi:RNA binding exosome subunit
VVIQSNMSSKAIVKVWGETRDVFLQHSIPLTEKPLKQVVEDEKLFILLEKLNAVVGSSGTTCIEGG